MMRFFKRPYAYAAVFSVALAAFTAYALLHAFVLKRAGDGTPIAIYTTGGTTAVKTDGTGETGSAASAAETTAEPTGTVITDSSYTDKNIAITITTLREYDTTVYVADIRLSDIMYLKTALAEGTYGRNYKEKTSAMAKKAGAILAINGDYYGFRDDGIVVRNGILYRSAASSDDGLLIGADGEFSIIEQTKTVAASLTSLNAWQVLSFGPALVEDGKIAVTSKTEVDQSMNSNPRTAIGEISTLHYVMLVSDGRTTVSAGLSLLELAETLQKLGCQTAYNLDGGGSSTMWFNGKVINQPTTDGRSIQERSISDIVYIGY